MLSAQLIKPQMVTANSLYIFAEVCIPAARFICRVLALTQQLTLSACERFHQEDFRHARLPLCGEEAGERRPLREERCVDEGKVETNGSQTHNGRIPESSSQLEADLYQGIRENERG